MFEMLMSHSIRRVWLRERSRCVRRTSLWTTKAFGWRQFGICFILFYHFLFNQMPDILSAVLQIHNLSNNMVIMQLQSVATTSGDESSHTFLHIPKIASPEVFYSLKSCTRWKNHSKDHPKCSHRREFLCCMFTLCNITVCLANLSPLPSYVFIAERQIKKLPDKRYPMPISCKSLEI